MAEEKKELTTGQRLIAGTAGAMAGAYEGAKRGAPITGAVAGATYAIANPEAKVSDISPSFEKRIKSRNPFSPF